MCQSFFNFCRPLGLSLFTASSSLSLSVYRRVVSQTSECVYLQHAHAFRSLLLRRQRYGVCKLDVYLHLESFLVWPFSSLRVLTYPRGQEGLELGMYIHPHHSSMSSYDDTSTKKPRERDRPCEDRVSVFCCSSPPPSLTLSLPLACSSGCEESLLLSKALDTADVHLYRQARLH